MKEVKAKYINNDPKSVLKSPIKRTELSYWVKN